MRMTASRTTASYKMSNVIYDSSQSSNMSGPTISSIIPRKWIHCKSLISSTTLCHCCLIDYIYLSSSSHPPNPVSTTLHQSPTPPASTHDNQESFIHRLNYLSSTILYHCYLMNHIHLSSSNHPLHPVSTASRQPPTPPVSAHDNQESFIYRLNHP